MADLPVRAYKWYKGGDHHRLFGYEFLLECTSW
jgi:hypothetical protein